MLGLQDKLLQIVLTIPAILIAFTFHEYAHAFMADRLGDKTPKFQGRLTLNPLVHIDIFGFLMILIAGFGWAKPVQTNPSAYKHYYKDDLKVSIAGPITNLLVALIFAIICGLFFKFEIPLAGFGVLFEILIRMMVLTIRINVMLFFFNMLPLPGLDGFHVFRDLFPSKFHLVADKLYRYQMLILVIFIATPAAFYIIGRPTEFVTNLLLKISTFIAF